MGNPAEANLGVGTSSIPTEPPPPYTPGNIAATSSTTTTRSTGDATAESYESRVLLAQTSSPYRPFPPVMYLYWKAWKLTRQCTLGDDDNHEQFAMVDHTGWGSKGPGRPSIVLHNGPSMDSPALAVAGLKHDFATARGLDSLISVVTVAPPASNTSKSEPETLSADTSFLSPHISSDPDSVAFRFSAVVAGQEEEFEWRRIRDSLPDTYVNGFELVRFLSRPAKTSEVSGLEQPTETLVRMFWKSLVALTKVFKFEFVGAGRTGEMGDHWATKALSTGLRVYSMRLDNLRPDKFS